jgi:hypothetical protein
LYRGSLIGGAMAGLFYASGVASCS